MTDDG